MQQGDMGIEAQDLSVKELSQLSHRVQSEPAPRVRAVIFDLDGTLIDSEPNYFLADRELLGRYGVPFTEAEKRRYIGSSNLAMMEDFVQRYGLQVAPAALAAEKNELYLRIAEAHTPVFPQMRRFLDLLVAHHVPVAVASGSGLEVIRRLVKQVGLDGPFAHLVSADEVAHGKPAPDVFLEAARRLGVAPAACLVVEDACPGVEAAHRAHMRCIAVPTLTDPPLPATFGLADLLFPEGMDSFDPDRAWAWVQGQC
jgi:HAD superfamily hydrolase (TIGR01509 family)